MVTYGTRWGRRGRYTVRAGGQTLVPEHTTPRTFLLMIFTFALINTSLNLLA
jgi:hypothetical protein